MRIQRHSCRLCGIIAMVTVFCMLSKLERLSFLRYVSSVYFICFSEHHSLQSTQRLCEQRSGLGSTGLLMFKAFLLAKEYTTTESAPAVAAELLDGFTFLYAEVKEHNNKVSSDVQ